ncbi:MAG: type II secretion system protein E [Parcubacteria group bacterium GW2011_GWB1_44_7]|nr:MAG: type II secretion system protein E [Parcubacteria group bacterium GW2011_GWB1_44_7]
MGILETLVKKNIIADEDVPAIKKELKESGAKLDEILQKRGVATVDLLAIKGEFYGVPVKVLDNQGIPFEILRYVPEESAVHYKFAPLSITDGILEIGMVEPDNIEARDALNFISSKIGLPYKAYLISRDDFEKIAQMYKGLSGEVSQALTELETELAGDQTELAETKIVESGQDGKISARIIEDAPVTKIVATILHYAVEGNASDVHIEHLGEKVRVRYRVDGVLNTSLLLPPKVHAAVVARVKILSNMRLDEKRKPQDGRFSARISGRKIDFRVSTFPAYYGEKVVMRILDSEKGVKSLESMGLSTRNLQLIRNAIQRPYGMILISGPTGSGKSTTLYSMLNEVDKETKNVLSLEDPVEYNIPGMSQSQVRPEIGYTFATGLRTTLRQDPDVIMVGEIRDKETAGLAIQAALTGHLVFSTIHTNNAIGAIPRLLDMGVDPYLIPPTLILAIAQRLVKTICPNSGKPILVEGSIKLMVEKQLADLPAQYRSQIPIGKDVLEATPTPECPKGTRGREAVMEVLEMNRDLEAAILKGASEAEMFKIARAQGMLTMKEDALVKAFRHEIPFEEVNEL